MSSLTRSLCRCLVLNDYLQLVCDPLQTCRNVVPFQTCRLLLPGTDVCGGQSPSKGNLCYVILSVSNVSGVERPSKMLICSPVDGQLWFGQEQEGILS